MGDQLLKEQAYKACHLLEEWMDEANPDWRTTAKLGGKHPGNYFDNELQSATAALLMTKDSGK